MEKTATAPRFGGRHFDNIKEGMPQMEWIGGPERLQAVQKSMEEKEPTLAACPFCGSQPFSKGVWAYNRPAIIAFCPACGCRTSWQTEGLDIVDRKRWTLEQCITEAVARWNRRPTA